jgi:hypothetical protein
MAREPVEIEKPKPATESEWIEAVRRQVAPLRYGTVVITVHDGRVVQIEKTERIRLEKRG